MTRSHWLCGFAALLLMVSVRGAVLHADLVATPAESADPATDPSNEWTIVIAPRARRGEVPVESVARFGQPVRPSSDADATALVIAAARSSRSPVTEPSDPVKPADQSLTSSTTLAPADVSDVSDGFATPADSVPMAEVSESSLALETFRQRDRSSNIVHADAVDEGNSEHEPVNSDEGNAAVIDHRDTAVAPPADVVVPVSHRTYLEIYNSIPFSRTEYDANPRYRHDATMELLIGQLRPVIVAPVAAPHVSAQRPVYLLRRDRFGTWLWSPGR